MFFPLYFDLARNVIILHMEGKLKKRVACVYNVVQDQVLSGQHYVGNKPFGTFHSRKEACCVYRVIKGNLHVPCEKLNNCGY